MITHLNTLRQQIKIKLQKLTPKARIKSAQSIATKIIQDEIFIQSQNIACYIPIENEVDTWQIIKTIWQQNKNCYLPAFVPHQENLLCFVKFMTNDRLKKVKHRVFEPEIVPEKIIPPQELDLVIVPLMGFNTNNFRLGRGTGCYDYTFEFIRHSKTQVKPFLLGIGYKCQQTEFEPNPWDIAMNKIVVA